MNRLKYFSITLHTLRSHTKINKAEAIWCPFWNAVLAEELCLTHLWICPLGHHFPISCFNRTPKWAFVYHEFIVLHCWRLPCSQTGNSQQLFSPRVHNHQKTFTKYSQQLIQAARTDGCCSPEPLQPCNGVVRLEHAMWLWHHIVT